MIRRNPLKLLFYLCLAIVVALVGYKVYLNFFKQDFEALHSEQVERIHQRTPPGSGIRFAVVGNINNSVGIFERRFIPTLNQASVDFLVSSGNAVSGGGEDKYRALYGTLSHLDIPYLLTFGPHEYENFGSFRFYDHFGPHFYSVRAGNTRLIFLDSTGKTPWRWQIRWLRDLLAHDTSNAHILFIGHPLLQPETPALFDDEDDYLQPPAFREELLQLIREQGIDLVFSANLSLFDEQVVGGTPYITTGGAGGLVLNTEDSFYHYVDVRVSPDGDVSYQMERLEVGQHPVWKRLESLWFFVYSLFYTGYLNFILIVSVFLALTIKLYQVIFIGKDYYPDYDLDPTPWLDKPLRVTMFTNNYLPFIGGVPISIERLRRGLEHLGDSTQIVAPRYRDQPDREDAVVRVPSLLAMGEKREFRLANIFLARIRKQVRAFRPDVIHLHHPFWLGSLGLFMARQLRIPAIYTYHTRLEHYAHFVPLPGMLFRNLISHALIKRFANRCDGVIVPTYSTEEYLRMIGVTTPTFVQPTGIEYERFQAVETSELKTLRDKLGLSSEKVFISVARLSNEKNIDFMIEAIDRLRQESDVPFRFLMIGDGHQRDRLQKKIDSLELSSHFTLVGAVQPEEMALWYNLGDAFLFASKSETQGMVILEAMSAGLPVVAVRSSGIEDVVRDGLNGYKTPENQARWIEKARQLLENDDLRTELSDKARAFAADYSIEQFARDVRGIYATSLAAREKHRKRSS
ncbi:MAG: glycosyltransferase [Marinobacter sp.]|uniref:glycosyltransferase n=1 Tax=Marinobacter sp. TaxID=50741 RepID=UPI0029C23BEF|nr:glycosyltransferase [Marinobacter sp.]MDX5441987.1 glycosyltransferase [Alteromonadaceae bacterium]MDX5329442.1 glycosyltransferase [Marinobacter sp.]MDX5336925.1 glycosyltransferase [Marinobacter sp.]MDX5388124.1 glycosyltransferase [Marinobacter sp.]MDX5473395.1 glycosyltransferase [Marinobacter sp.]